MRPPETGGRMIRGNSLMAAIEDAARLDPSGLAWTGDRQMYSYGQLNQDADRLAQHLLHSSIGTGDRVGLFLERGPDMGVAMLGVLKSGAAFLPLGLEEPAVRRTAILRDGEPAAVIVHPATVDRFTNGWRVVDLHAAIDDSSSPVSTPKLDVGANHVAYVLYTSGSTGKPKGVVVEHGNLLAHIDWLAEHLPLGQDDRLLQFSPYTFDASMTDFFWPLSCGATVVSMAEGDYLDPLIVVQTLVEKKITAVRLPPAMMPLLLAEPALREAIRLRYLICGGERFPAPLARRIRETLPWVRFFNRYGPTEAAVAVTYHEVTDADDLGDGDLPIGSPVADVELHIADDDGRIVDIAPGLSGELLIGGAPVARGYLGDSALTLERFVDLPEVGRVFRSGDVVRVTEAGALLFVGRRDEQVQVAGNRVELGDVRSALCAHPHVESCVVTVREDTGAALAAYVVAGSERPEADELRAFVRSLLPRHMVPSRITFLDRLPLTDRGKVDLAALARLGEPIVSEPEPPSAEESVVRLAWREVLGTADGSRGFLDCGGSSLQAARLASRLRSRLGVTVTTGDILGHTDLDALDRWVAELGRHFDESPKGRPADSESPMSFLQERLWFMHEFAPDEPVYNFQAIYHFTGDLDESALRTALSGVIERHEILRTTFVSRDGIPHQLVHDRADPAVTVLDLSDAGLTIDQLETEARQAANQFVRRVFDITTLPLVRWCLIRLDEHHSWLVHSQHHLTHDGWSFSVFLDELLRRYRAAVGGVEVHLVDPVLQCGDFAYRQRRWWDKRGKAEHLGYWLDHLRGVPPLALAARSGALQDQTGTQVRRRVHPELVQRIKHASSKLSVTPFMFCFSTWAVFLWTLTGQRDFAIGTAVVNRPWEDAEHMLGCVLNNIPIRVAPEPDAEFGTLVGQTAELLLDGYAHEGAPLHAIVEALRLPRSTENPVFQTTFNFHDAPFPDLTLPGVRMVLEEAVTNGTAKFPIDVIVITEAQQRTGRTGPDEWDLVYHASARYFDAKQAETTADAFLSLLAQVASDHSVRLAGLVTPSISARALPAAAVSADVAVTASPGEDGDRASVRDVAREVWISLLRIADLADNDDFFERGGHSLLAVRAVSLIRARLDRSIPVRTIFETHTFSSFVDAVVESGQVREVIS